MAPHSEQATKAAAAAAGSATAAGLSFLEFLDLALRLGCMTVALVSGLLAIISWFAKRKKN